MRDQAVDDSTGWIFNVQRFSVHDGPGIRTTIFFKGCPLQCLWCDNPESQRPEPELVYWRERCIRCDACLHVCPHGAILVYKNGTRQVADAACDRCGRCLEECYAGALEMIGRRVSVEELLDQAEGDRPFYEASGGGVTLSGGEPTLQPAFARRLLEGCRKRGLHTAIESCGLAPWPTWQALLPHLDLILYDLKEVDSHRHEQLTGTPNALILDNLERLAHTGKPIIVRRPVIPGCNDGEASIHALGRLVQRLGTVHEVHLLPYHRFGRSKYERLGRAYPMGDEPSLREEQLYGLREILVAYGLRVKIGG